jgi:hypothetical protein
MIAFEPSCKAPKRVCRILTLLVFFWAFQLCTTFGKLIYSTISLIYKVFWFLMRGSIEPIDHGSADSFDRAYK